jgi:hypothetical protein
MSTRPVAILRPAKQPGSHNSLINKPFQKTWINSLINSLNQPTNFVPPQGGTFVCVWSIALPRQKIPARALPRPDVSLLPFCRRYWMTRVAVVE